MAKQFSHLVVTTNVHHRFQVRIAVEQILELLRQHGCEYPSSAKLSIEGGHFVIEWDRTPTDKQAAVSYDIPLQPLSGKGMGEPEPADSSSPEIDLPCTRVREEDIKQAEAELQEAVGRQLSEAEQEEIYLKGSLGRGDERA